MNSAIQHFHFEPGTLIAYDGYEVVVTGPVKGGVAVRDRHIHPDENVRYFVLSDEKVHALLLRHDVVIDAEFSSDAPDDPGLEEKEIAFEDQTPEVRHVAFQKEAFCLAAKSVLKGRPFYPSLIEENLTTIIQNAFERQRLKARGPGRDRAFPATSWGARSISNFCKSYFGMKTPHPRILVNEKPKGNTNPKLDAHQEILLDQCCRSYLSKAQPSGASIVRLVNDRFRDAQRKRLELGDSRPLKTPHRNTVYRRLARFTRLELVVGREGYRAAQKEFSPTQHGVRALKPGELIELDFWKADVFTFSEQSKFWDLLTPDVQKVIKEGKPRGKRKERQRLWICVAFDVATRMVLGLGIAATPNDRTVIEVLDMVMRDKSDISAAAQCKMPWSQKTGLGTVVFDTGTEFFNEKVQSAILAAGGSFILGRTAVPMDKPFIERFFGGFRTLFADELPGKAGYSASCLIDYDKEGMAAFNAEEMRLLMVRYIVDFYPLREHAGLFGKRPLDCWKDAQKYGAVHTPPPRVRRNATGLKVIRKLTKEGIRVCGLPFGDTTLFPHHIFNGKNDVEVRIDANDLQEVTIILEGQKFHLANQRPDLGRHSIRTLMAAIKAMRASRSQDRDYYEYTLAKYADGQAEKIAAGVSKHGLPSTEVTAEELDWFEHNFCLRLNIIKTPKEVESADPADLFSGRPGKGISTAGDIAAEQMAGAASDETATLGEEPEFADGAVSPQEALDDNMTKKRKARSSSTAGYAGQKQASRSKAPRQTGRTFTGTPQGKGKFT